LMLVKVVDVSTLVVPVVCVSAAVTVALVCVTVSACTGAILDSVADDVEELEVAATAAELGSSEGIDTTDVDWPDVTESCVFVFVLGSETAGELVPETAN